MKFTIHPDKDGERFHLQIEERLAARRQAKPKTSFLPGENPELLRALVRKGVAPAPTSSAKPLTSHDVHALRTCAVEHDASAVSGVKRSIAAFFANLSSSVSGMFLKPVDHGRKQCETQGHEWPAVGWQGPYPICPRCGVEITSKSQLANKQQQGQKDLKPYNNRLELK